MMMIMMMNRVIRHIAYQIRNFFDVFYLNSFCWYFRHLILLLYTVVFVLMSFVVISIALSLFS